MLGPRGEVGAERSKQMRVSLARREGRRKGNGNELEHRRDDGQRSGLLSSDSLPHSVDQDGGGVNVADELDGPNNRGIAGQLQRERVRREGRRERRTCSERGRIPPNEKDRTAPGVLSLPVVDETAKPAHTYIHEIKISTSFFARPQFELRSLSALSPRATHPPRRHQSTSRPWA